MKLDSINFHANFYPNSSNPKIQNTSYFKGISSFFYSWRILNMTDRKKEALKWHTKNNKG